jgi:hypothetical protein
LLHISHRAMDSAEVTQYYWLDEIEPAALTQEKVFFDIKVAFLSGLAAFVLCLIYIGCTCRYFWGAKAARHTIAIQRFLVMLHIINDVILLTWTLSISNPTRTTSWPTVRLNSTSILSYVHDWPRGTVYILFIMMGIAGDYHASFDILTICGCLMTFLFDSISALEITAYISAIKSYEAPSGDYTITGLRIYYYRDIVGIAISSMLIFCVFHFMVIVGIMGEPRYIPNNVLHGNDEDRGLTARKQRYEYLKSIIEKKKALGQLVPDDEGEDKELEDQEMWADGGNMNSIKGKGSVHFQSSSPGSQKRAKTIKVQQASKVHVD